VTGKEVARYAELKGWRFVRRGARKSHVIYDHPDHWYHVSIPLDGSRDVSKGLLADLLKQINGTWKGPQR
jgi:predicted RNA binding protein YcfA (HicA-like mRNA interferase family)